MIILENNINLYVKICFIGDMRYGYFDEVKKELIKKLTQEKQREKFDKYVEILEGRFNVKRNL